MLVVVLLDVVVVTGVEVVVVDGAVLVVGTTGAGAASVVVGEPG